MTFKLAEETEIKLALKWLSKYWDKPIRPDYYRASTIDEAISLLNKYGQEAKILAGGIDIIGLIKNKIIFPRVLVNIKPINYITDITENHKGIAIGALSRINDIAMSNLIKSKYTILFEAARSVSSPLIRNMATIGGNICQDVRCWYYRRSPDTGFSYNCHRKNNCGICYAVNGENQQHAIIGGNKCFAVCPSDMASALLALNASVCTIHTSGGRTIPISEFYTTSGNILYPNEVIKTIQVPKITGAVKQRFIKFRLRDTIDFAIASVATVITLHNDIVSDARIVLGGVSASPYRAVHAETILIGKAITKSTAEEVAISAVSEAVPLSKNGYKVSIVKALVERALLK